jgi:hypothetical protein
MNSDKMNGRIERRYSFNPVNSNEFRARVISDSGNTDSSSRKIRGYASVFNQKSKIITEWIPEKGEYRTFNEVIEPQAYNKLYAKNWGIDVVLNVNHQYNEMVARLAAGTLVLGIDEQGLYYKTDLLTTARAEDLYQNIMAGNYYESSFRFVIAEDGERWEYDQTQDIWTRYISDIELLFDVCVATYFGAYSNTSISVIGDTRTAFMVYDENDICVAKQRLNHLISQTQVRTTEIPENTDYLIELELDRDKISVLN